MNPYVELPPEAFWRLAVASKSLFDISGLWNPKFDVRTGQSVVTFGSCFAQHIGRALVARGFKWLCTETAPFGMSDANSRIFNYSVFSARTGNIYTTSQLKQWTQWALGKVEVPDEYWLKDGRYHDPFRPGIEPSGFSSSEELRQSQNETIKRFREAIVKARYFVFTLGLTESWFHQSGYEYPTCPGTVAGEFDGKNHQFVNQGFKQIYHNLTGAIRLMRTVNPQLQFILTVSPVPLTATNSGNHVLVATMESKSILRAVAGQIAAESKHVDYFPSYEIINSPVFKGVFFEPNLRSVNPCGVNFVMNKFFSSLDGKFGGSQTVEVSIKHKVEELVCEEALLDAFGKDDTKKP